jgi:hypothetical protein
MLLVVLMLLSLVLAQAVVEVDQLTQLLPLLVVVAVLGHRVRTLH